MEKQVYKDNLYRLVPNWYYEEEKRNEYLKTNQEDANIMLKLWINYIFWMNYINSHLSLFFLIFLKAFIKWHTKEERSNLLRRYKQILITIIPPNRIMFPRVFPRSLLSSEFIIYSWVVDMYLGATILRYYVIGL